MQRRLGWLTAAALLWPLCALAEPPAPLEIAEDPRQPTPVGPTPTPNELPATPHPRGHFPEGLFLPVGVGFASASHPDSPTAFAFGAEASVVAFPIGHANWLGAYADVFHESKNDRTRASLGLEAGFTFIGVDGGLVMQVSDDGTHWGGVVRPMFTVAFLTLFGRWGWFARDEDFRELGVLVKLPFPLMELDFHEPPPAPPPPR